MTREQVIRALMRMQRKRSLRQFAKDIDVSAAYLSDVYLGKRTPGPKLLEVVGVTKVSTLTYQREK